MDIADLINLNDTDVEMDTGDKSTGVVG